MDYKMIVEIPLTEVPDGVSVQEAKVTAEIWLKGKLPEAELMELKPVEVL